MTRIQGILAAGTLTVIVIASVLAFGNFGFARADSNAGATIPNPAETQQIVDQQQALQETLSVMQQREAEYNAQLEAANQTIARLEQAQIGTLSNEQAGAELQAASQTISQLEASLAVMQQRETQYAAQIEAANQSILQLQNYIDQMNGQAAPSQQASVQQQAPAASSYSDDDHYEEFEYEDEHEFEHEGGEDD